VWQCNQRLAFNDFTWFDELVIFSEYRERSQPVILDAKKHLSL